MRLDSVHHVGHVQAAVMVGEATNVGRRHYYQRRLARRLVLVPHTSTRSPRGLAYPRSTAAHTSSADTALWYNSPVCVARRRAFASDCAPPAGATTTLRPEGSQGPKRPGSLGPNTATTGVRTAVARCMAP